MKKIDRIIQEHLKIVHDYQLILNMIMFLFENMEFKARADDVPNEIGKMKY